MPPRIPDAYRSAVVSADTLVKTGQGWIYGFIVNASATGNIRLYDNTAASGTELFPSTPVFARDEYMLPVEFVNGLYFDLVSGAATVTILYI